MPLLKKPLPVIPKRLYHVRIEEPLALRMERYAEFLEAKTVDHVISQALDFCLQQGLGLQRVVSRTSREHLPFER